MSRAWHNAVVFRRPWIRYVLIAALSLWSIYMLFANKRFPSTGAGNIIASNPAHSTPVHAAPVDVQLPHLEALCAKTTWTPGLYVQCHSSCGRLGKDGMCGGLNNARNRVTTCVRWAMEIGAGVIITRVVIRSPSLRTDGVGGDGEGQCPDAWFDMAAMKQMLAKHCPGMAVETCGRPDWMSTPKLRLLIPEQDRPFWVDPFDVKQRRFRDFYQRELARANVDPASITATEPAVLVHGDTFQGWDFAVSDEMATMRADLFKILPFNQTLAQLGRDMSESPELEQGAYFAVHLRVEADWPSDRGLPQDQMNHFRDTIVNISQTMPDAKDVKAVYVSCGDRDAIQRFRDMLEPLHYKVIDKWTFKDRYPDKYGLVDALDFDAKGAVEFEVMFRSRFFMGNSMSTMALLLSYARTLDDDKDFFDEYLNPGSTRGDGRRYYEAMVIKGNGHTNLLAVSGPDVMDSFP